VSSDSWRREPRDDFTLSELLNALWARRRLVVGIVSIFVLCSVPFDLLQEPAYVAEATVVVRPEAFSPAGVPEETLTRETMNAAITPDLPRDAMQRSGWTGSPQEFNDRLGVETDQDAGKILVSFSATTAEEASRAANAYAEAFARRVEELSQRTLAGGTLEASAEVTRQASPPEERSSPRPLLYVALAGAAGLLLGGAVALALESRTRKWRGEKDAELTLRAPVLGVIPGYHPAEERPEDRVG
jgi:capsular polysaccharide biosynthesis protein